MVRSCPNTSVVLGHVGKIGESESSDIPFERVSNDNVPEFVRHFVNYHGVNHASTQERNNRNCLSECSRDRCWLVKPLCTVPSDRDENPVRGFKSFTADLEQLADWLKACDIEWVAMESTGVYWIPMFELLESRGFKVYLVNARHVKNVAGRKSDVLDCQWIQQLMSYGLLSGAFRPKDEVCALRSVSRQRDMLLRYQSRHIQHMQKALAQMNIQLANVISDIAGETGQKIIRAILGGERDGANVWR